MKLLRIGPVGAACLEIAGRFGHDGAPPADVSHTLASYRFTPVGLPSRISGIWRFPSTAFRRTVLPIAPKASKSRSRHFPAHCSSSSRLGREADPEEGTTVVPGPPPLNT